MFSVLSVAGVIVLAVYATGIGAGSFLGFLILLGTVFAGAGYIVACRACSVSFTAFERTYITCGMGAAAFGVLSYLALNRALEVLPVARTAALINFSTVVSVLAGVLILREPFGWVSAAASAAILVGIWGVQRFAAPALPDADKRTEPLPPS